MPGAATPPQKRIFSVVQERDPSLNLSTVYRTLRWLEQEGLVSARRFDEERRQERFDPALPTSTTTFSVRFVRRSSSSLAPWWRCSPRSSKDKPAARLPQHL